LALNAVWIAYAAPAAMPMVARMPVVEWKKDFFSTPAASVVPAPGVAAWKARV